jgi:hypothetical protein
LAAGETGGSAPDCAALRVRLIKRRFRALHDAYMIPDTRVFLASGLPSRQVSTVNSLAQCAPSVIFSSRQAYRSRRDGNSSIGSAIVEACNLPREDVRLPSGKKVSTRWVLALFSEYPLEQAALDDLMAFENPMVLESMEAAMQTQQGRGRQS